MFHPRRLRTRSPSSVETMARKHPTSTRKDHPEPEGGGPGGREHRVGQPQQLEGGSPTQGVRWAYPGVAYSSAARESNS
jgi:hypothetical protein